MPISADEAIALFVEALRAAPPLSNTYVPNARHSSQGCDVSVYDVFTGWWHKEHRNKNPMPDPGEVDYAPFYDAVWELSRRGVLRPGPAFPGLAHSIGIAKTEANGFSLTSAGREWVKKYDQQGPFPLDQSRFAALVAPYAARFGDAFIQRINEAAGCYRTLNYLATCAMAGAACEAILLRLAIAKTGDEAVVIKMYFGRDGRRSLITKISTGLKPYLQQGLEISVSLLSYWRDNAAHAYATDISEFAAHDALSRLLRFSQFVDQNWDELTATTPP